MRVAATTRLSCGSGRSQTTGEVHEEEDDCSSRPARPRSQRTRRLQVARREPTQRRSRGSVGLPARQRRQARHQHRFDNVHFARDNPNVPSDLEQMPHLLNFLKSNGTVFSNTHTPMIAHTADDSLTIYTGLYGDRHGQPLSNSYKVFNPNGSTDPATSFVYWTSPIIDTKVRPAGSESGGHHAVDRRARTARSRRRRGCRSRAPVARSATSRPRTWCSRTPPATSRRCSAPTRRRRRRRPRTPPIRSVTSRSPNTSARPCTARQGSDFCAGSTRAVGDQLPDEPGGYNGFQGVFGAKYINPQIGGGPNVFHNGYRVTDANGNLVDLNGNTIRSRSRTRRASPGFSPVATQSLAVIADMQEAGIPVTYGYISDLHEKKSDTRPVARRPRHRRPPAGRSAPATPATSRTPSTTTLRSRRSSSGSRRTASRRRTRCS